jgi:dCMP deaminase
VLNDFDVELLKLSYKVAKFSDDPSTQNGAIIHHGGFLFTEGFNHIPKPLKKSPDRLERPQKYDYMEHGERHAIYSAAKNGASTEGATLFTGWSVCTDCARSLIISGIKRVVGHKQAYDKTPPRWIANMIRAKLMLQEAGISIDLYDGKLFSDNFTILFDGKEFAP